MHVQVSRRSEATRSGVEDMRGGMEDIRRRVLSASWVALLLAILVFLVIYPVLTLLLGALLLPLGYFSGWWVWWLWGAVLLNWV